MTSLKEWVIWTLRKASYRWPPRGQALRGAAVNMGKGSAVRKKFPRCRNFYECAGCEEVFPRQGVSIDHINPVVDPRKGWQGFDVYITRLFCEASGFQVLCNDCHDKKTARERKIRNERRKAA